MRRIIGAARDGVGIAPDGVDCGILAGRGMGLGCGA